MAAKPKPTRNRRRVDQGLALYGSRGPTKELGNALPHERPLTNQLRWAKAKSKSKRPSIDVIEV